MIPSLNIMSTCCYLSVAVHLPDLQPAALAPVQAEGGVVPGVRWGHLSLCAESYDIVNLFTLSASIFQFLMSLLLCLTTTVDERVAQAAAISQLSCSI